MDTIRLDLASLLSRGPLLRQDALRPGDVLLVKGNTRSSSFIAKATKGEYSHAAIWLPGGDECVESLLLAESDTGGVGFTFLMPMTLYAGKISGGESVYEIPCNPEKLILLRHPECENLDLAKLRQASVDLQTDDFYKAYSAYPRLLETVVLTKTLHSVASMLAQISESCRRDKGTRGMFCSELVAEYFSKLGLELFTDGREPHTVSPNDFLLPECRLTVVEKAFVDTLSLPSQTYSIGTKSQEQQRNPHLRAMINRRNASDTINKNVDALEESLRNTNQALNEQLCKISDETQVRIAERITLAELWNEPEQVEKLQRLAVIHNFGHCLLQCLNEHDERQRFEKKPAEDINSWNDASATLTFIAGEMMSRAQSALLRNTILTGIRSIRKIYRDYSPRRVQVMKFRILRARMFKVWEKHKRENRQDLEFNQRLHSTDVLSEQAQRYIHEIIHQAFQLQSDELSRSELN